MFYLFNSLSLVPTTFLNKIQTTLTLHNGSFFMLLLLSADFFQKCNMVVDQDQDQTVCKGYQQRIKVVASKEKSLAE